ncbi:hypothetical protein ACHAXS_010867 [Conticribra weissflogii]
MDDGNDSHQPKQRANNLQKSFNIKLLTTSMTPPTVPPSLPKYLSLSLLHILGGTTDTPIVLLATKHETDPFGRPSTVSLAILLIASRRHRNLCHYPKRCPLSVVPPLPPQPLLGPPLLQLPMPRGRSRCQLILPVFRSIDPVVAYLQLPYLVWLEYVTVLNREICRLNPMVGWGERGHGAGRFVCRRGQWGVLQQGHVGVRFEEVAEGSGKVCLIVS